MFAVVAVMAAVVVACNEAEDADPEPAAQSDEPCYELGWKECPTEPYPFSTPLPPAEPTAIDGRYTRTVDDSIAGAPGKCRRCPPYRLQPGDETLVFDRGRFFVTHEPPGFRSSGHFTLDGDRLVLFNDPSCIDFEGTYEWRVEGGTLELRAIEDECPFTQLRQRFLMARDWRLEGAAESAVSPECVPPSEEAAVTGHWPIPPECEGDAREA
jgi:hypothetical protein